MNIATPVLEDLGIAPTYTWTWMSLCSNSSAATPSCALCPFASRERGLRALLHHLAERPVRISLP